MLWIRNHNLGRGCSLEDITNIQTTSSIHSILFSIILVSIITEISQGEPEIGSHGRGTSTHYIQKTTHEASALWS